MKISLKSSRIISVIVCALLLAASLPLYASAEGSTSDVKQTFFYTALGDGSTAGFGLSRSSGYGVLTSGTYPAALKNSIAAKGFELKVNQLAMKGMRTEELRYLLDDNYQGDAYLKENFPELARKRSAYRNAIRNSDLVTYALGTVNFGSYLLYVAGDVQNRCDDPQVRALAAEDKDGIRASLNNEINSLVDKVPAIIKSTVQSFIDDFSKDYVDAAVYAYYSFCLSYEESIRLIRAQNPDADIIVLGIDNMLGNFYVKAAGVSFKLGELYDQHVVTRVNNKLQSADGIYGFISTSGVSRFMDEVAAYDGNTAHISQQFKDYCDVYEDDFILKTQLDKDLASYKDDKKKKGYTAGYNTVEQCLKSVTECNGEELNVSYIAQEDNRKAIADMGKQLMAGIKAKSQEYAVKAAKGGSYTEALRIFINGATGGTREGKLYGIGKSAARGYGRFIMAFGMRTAMGEGFFQQPTAAGHSQIAGRIWDAYKNTKLHRTVADPTCEKPGVKAEYWYSFETGKFYSEETCENELSATDLFIKPLGHQFQEIAGSAVAPTCTKAGRGNDHICTRDNCGYMEEGAVVKALGHKYGSWKTVKANGVGVDGKKQCKCIRCSATKTAVIPGYGPANTRIKKIKAGKKSFKVTWKLPSKANLKKTTGYQIRYSLKKSMAGAKTVTISKKKTTSKTIKGLKAKKKYYVQIRTFKKTGSKKYYSKTWSAKKTVKTK